MERIRRTKNSDYTTISNVFLRDKRLSLKAKGFLALVMSLPENWDFSISGMVAIVQEGRNHIYNTIKELIENGYCDRQYIYEMGATGKKTRSGVEYVFTETPNLNSKNLNLDNGDLENLNSKNLNLDNLNLDNLNFENGTQISKEYNKVKNEEKKDLRNSFSSASHEAGVQVEDFTLKNFEEAQDVSDRLEVHKTPTPRFAPAPPSPIEIPTNQETNEYAPPPVEKFTLWAKALGCNGKSESYAFEFWHKWNAKDWIVNKKGHKMRNHEKRFNDFVTDKTAKKKEAHPAYKGMVDLFFEHHEQTFKRSFAGFITPEGVAINDLIAKIEKEIKDKKKREGIIIDAVPTEEIILGFKYILAQATKDEFLIKNFKPTIINGKFDGLINNVREKHKQNNGNINHTPKSDNRAKSHDELAYETYRIVAAKHGISVEELLARQSASNEFVS